MSGVPEHLAVIMDGNGRWAETRGKARIEGHRAGVKTVERVIGWCRDAKIRYLTLYAFSTENWRRPDDEVSALMALVLSSLQDDLFMRNNIRFRTIGDIDKLPEAVRKRLRQCESETAANDRMTLVVALSYSSRWEMTEAARRIAREVAEGKLAPDSISEDTITAHLNTAFMPDPELLIRTGGELRLSNYLLWQCAYTELYFTPVYWPDFSVDDFHRAIASYQGRQRRFGKTEEQAARDNRP